MRIQIIEASPHADGSWHVGFESSAGRARGKWVARDHAPQIGKFYTVELDVDVVADKKSNVCVERQEPHTLSARDDTALIEATAEAVDEDGLAFLRLSDDCLLMVETSGGITPGDVVRIAVPTRSLVITMTGI
jgi:hypothetical protein